jgi:hypothetical protein
MELHWLLFVVFTLGANVSSPIQVGQTPYPTKSDCVEAAAQSAFSKPGGYLQAVTWCGPVRLEEAALPSAPPVPPTEAPKRPARRRR